MTPYFFNPTPWESSSSKICERHEQRISLPEFREHIDATAELAKSGQSPQFLVLKCIKGDTPESHYKFGPGIAFVANTKCASVPPYGCESTQDISVAAWLEYGLHLGEKLWKSERRPQHLAINCNTSALFDAAKILANLTDENHNAVKERFLECAPYSYVKLISDPRPLDEKFKDFCHNYIIEQTENLYAYPDAKQAVLEGRLTIAGSLINTTKDGYTSLETPISYKLLTETETTNEYPLLQRALFERFCGEYLEESKPLELNVYCSDSRNIPDLFHCPKDSLSFRNPGVFFLPEIFEVEAILQLYPSITTINFISHTGCGAMKAMLDPESLEHLPEVKKYIETIKDHLKNFLGEDSDTFKELTEILVSPKTDTARLEKLTAKIRVIQIQKLAEYLQTHHPETSIQIDGHTFHLEDSKLEHHKDERRTPSPVPICRSEVDSFSEPSRICTLVQC